MESTLHLALILLAAGVLIAILEVFIPSGGLLGIVSAGFFIGGIAVAWSHSGAWGMGTLLGCLVLIPILIVVGFRMFPHTPLGRKMILAPPTSESTASAAGRTEPSPPAGTEPGITVGMAGRAGTDLRPSGTAFFNDRRVSVVTAGEWITRDAAVRVVKVEGNRIVVEAVS